MSCSRCVRFQRHVRLSKRTPQSTSRAFGTTQKQRDVADSQSQALATYQQTHALSILEHKKRPVVVPNDRPRSAVHNIDISNRLGTRLVRPVIGAMEWQTSTYHYNKHTSKVYPVLANKTNQLLEAYAVLKRAKRDKNGEIIPEHRTELARRRKSAERVYMSSANVKDYGNKVVIDVFVHDSAEEMAEAAKKRAAGRGGRQKPGAGNQDTRRRRRPMLAAGRRQLTQSSGGHAGVGVGVGAGVKSVVRRVSD